MKSEIEQIISIIEKAGHEAYLVGGCVRDTLRGVKPLDWDIASNAKPEEVAKLFKNNFQVEEYGLVTILTGSDDPTLKEVEVMPYRSEQSYSDKRHPDKLEWVDSVEEDLSRRDFTVNAMAMDLSGEIIDLFEGQKDIEKKVIKAVGDPEARFREDALRLMRAVRFASVLGSDWSIEAQTWEAIKNNSVLLDNVSQERIRDEFMKIILSDQAKKGIELFKDSGLLKIILPELEANIGVDQNKHHIFTCYEHAVNSLDYAVKQGYNKYVRLAALLHDIAKPEVKEGEGEDATFYNHEVVGAEMTERILERLRFPKETVKKVTKLVRYHLFYYNVDEVTESSVRKLVRNVGRENIDELLQVRYSDRIGSGCPKAIPYKLRHLQYVIEKIAKDPISVEMLKVSGDDIMSILDIKPGPKVGQVLNVLLSEVLDSPQDNKRKHLKKRVKELGQMTDKELSGLSSEARRETGEVKMKEDKMLKDKYWLK